jgi:hypothetical protein
LKKSSTSKPYEIYKDEVENDQMNLERIVNKVEVVDVASLPYIDSKSLSSDQERYV